jgi:hypothetical protein
MPLAQSPFISIKLLFVRANDLQIANPNVACWAERRFHSECIQPALFNPTYDAFHASLPSESSHAAMYCIEQLSARVEFRPGAQFRVLNYGASIIAQELKTVR